MISYFVSHSGSNTISDYLARAGKALAHTVDVLPYSDLHRLTAIAAGTCIFSALDQVSEVQRSVLPALTDQLGELGVRVLNDPRRVRLRYELLRAVHEAGQNEFGVYRSVDAAQVARFPVFVRDEHFHNGNLTPLLYTPGALEAALHDLMLRGRQLSGLLIVEFCDTSNELGQFRKYSAFKVGDTIIPRYLQVSDHWMIKVATRACDEDALAEDRAYIENNPHESWLREMFALARIDYGRIDYGMLNGRPQVWEINTNPSLSCTPPTARSRRAAAEPPEVDALKAIFHDRYAAALRMLAATESGEATLPIRLNDECRRQLRLDAERARRHSRLASCVTHVVESPLVQLAKPWLKLAVSRFAPVIAQIPRR